MAQYRQNRIAEEIKKNLDRIIREELRDPRVCGTFSITNVGVFGIDTGTPIINGDESAILAMGAIKRRPWVVGSGDDEQIVPRWVTTLAVSFDHQLIDGEQGSLFLDDVSTVLSEPELALLF